MERILAEIIHWLTVGSEQHVRTMFTPGRMLTMALLMSLCFWAGIIQILGGYQQDGQISIELAVIVLLPMNYFAVIFIAWWIQQSILTMELMIRDWKSMFAEPPLLPRPLLYAFTIPYMSIMIPITTVVALVFVIERFERVIAASPA